jgi:monomeric sarcosine oxidase
VDSEFDVIVIGLGAMGSAAAYQLARRGQRVLGIDQFTPAHELGSSHGANRIVRRAYFEGSPYVPLMARSYELWDELSAEFGEQLFTRCGCLMIGRPDSPIVRGTRASATQWAIPHEILDAAAVRSRFPQFAVPTGQVAVLEPDAGYVRPEVTVLAQIELAMAAGAELWFDTEVESVELGPGGVHLIAGDQELVAPKAVIATGAWATKLANLDRYPLTVSRQTMHWFAPTTSVLDFTADKMPVFLWDWPVADGEPPAELYGFPYLEGDSGVKVGLYHDGADGDIDPDLLERVVDDSDAVRLAEVLSQALPTLAGKRLDGKACMYGAVPGDDFVLGLHPGGSERVVVAVGFSGHGFKFAPVVGEIAADLVITGSTRHDIGFLAPARLTGF